MVTCFAPTVTNRYPKPGPQWMRKVFQITWLKFCCFNIWGPEFPMTFFFWITLASKTLSFFLFLYNMVTFHWAIWWVYWHTLERERERHSASNSDSDCNIASFSSPLAKELIIWKIARKNTQFSGNVSSKCLPRNHLGNSSYWTFALNVHEFPANTKYSALTKHNVNCG